MVPGAQRRAHQQSGFSTIRPASPSTSTPRRSTACRRLCQTVLDKTGTVTIRLTVNDLLAQMVYEGNVKVFNSDNTAFAFNSPEGVAWLQMYVDIVKAGTVDNTILTTNDDRVGLDAFSAGNAAFSATGPNLARTVEAGNATCTATSPWSSRPSASRASRARA